MKNQYNFLQLCLLAIFLVPMFSPVDVQADDELMPVLTKGKTWICQRQSSCDFTYTCDTLTVVKDTVMWDMNVKYVLDVYRPGRYMFGVDEDEPELKSKMFYLTENNGRIDRILTRWEKDEDGADKLCYYSSEPLIDMSLHKGDSVQCRNGNMSYPIICWIADEWRLPIQDLQRRVVRLVPEEDVRFNELDCWIEGIGHLYSWHNLKLDDYSIPTSGETGYILVECYEDDKLIYKAGDVEAALMAGVGSIPVDSRRVAMDGVIYDLNGRTVQHPRPGHIYIVNGRKVRWTE